MNEYDPKYWKHGVNVTAGQFCDDVKKNVPSDAVLYICGDKTAKDIIRKHNRSFGGSLTDDETMKQAGISRKSFYKYKKELRTTIRAAYSNERIEKDNGL